MKVSSIIFVLSTVAFAAFGGDCVLSEGWQFSLDGSAWREVEVPHDWAIAGPFDANSKDGDTGKLPWRGIGKYRKSFVVQKRDAAGTVALDFDGVMARPKVYVNGMFAGSHVFTAENDWNTPFAIPITDKIDRTRKKQTVVVRVEDKAGQGGIWRPIFLAVIDKTAGK